MHKNPWTRSALSSMFLGWVLVHASVASAGPIIPNPAGPIVHRTWKAGLDTMRVGLAGGGSGSCSKGVPYQGGPVMLGHVPIYLIWYGTKVQTNGKSNIIPTFINNLSESSYMAMNTTYSQSAGNFRLPGPVRGSFSVQGQVIDSFSQGNSLTNDSVATIVANAINGNDVDATTGMKVALPRDTNAIYLVLAPAGVSEASDDSHSYCNSYCGWHINGGFAAFNSDIKYAFVGDPVSCAACQWGGGATTTPTDKALDARLKTIAHEIEETLTDPDLNAWFQQGVTENPDLCSWDAGTTFTLPNGGQANLILGGFPFLIQRQIVNEGGGYGANGYGLPFFAQGGYGITGLPVGDWAFGSVKGQCSPGQPVIGVSEATNETQVRSVLCGNGADFPNYTQPSFNFANGGCYGLPFNPGDNRGTTVDGDWDFGAFKGECRTSEYVAGVSATLSGQLDGILCCPGIVTHTSCNNVELMFGQDSRDYTAPDWDFGDFKGQCSPGQYVAGISATASGSHPGAAHVLLCCSP